MPLYATLFVIAMLSSVGLPGLNGFIGEFLILAGSFKTHPAAAIVAATGVILAAIYLLWLVQRVFFGPVVNEDNKKIPEIAWNEVAAMVPLIVMMVWIGVHPNTFLHKMTPSVQRLLTVVQQGGERGNEMVAANRISNSEFRMTNEEARHPITRAADSFLILHSKFEIRNSSSPRNPLPAIRRPGGGQ
jgi:NADH-quinone oxidoreductase subunit M